ncbi:MAG: ELM1/GtrOC1 family putative glycosyltransferase [Candidatus Omnitrophota bacterium]|jgi:lauroyl/myristoyl acyltransferase
MKKNSSADYSAFILLKVLGPLFRSLPVGFCYFFGKALGFFIYHLDRRHREIAYANIKEALGLKFKPNEISGITKSFYQSFGQSIIELFLIPRIDKKYLKKYVDLVGEKNIHNALKKGRGVILLVVHECGWELSNIVAASLGVPFNVIVRDQGLPRLNGLLNDFRRQKGAKVISRGGELRQLVSALKNNESVAMTLDQGGSSGELVKFFGRNASISSGAIRLALKYGTEVLPVFFERTRGAYARIIINASLKIEKSGNPEEDLHNNLQKAINIFEGHIAAHPKEYLWTYKIWKYSDLKRVLLLSDGLPGHLRQVQAAAEIIKELLKEKGAQTELRSEVLAFRNKAAKTASLLSSCFASKFSCQGCSLCLKKLLKKGSYDSLSLYKPDIVISCSSSVSGINYIIAKINMAKSIVIMRPSLLNLNKFDLIIAPKHDNLGRKKNVLEINGALNLINEGYLKTQGNLLKEYIPGYNPKAIYIGVLIGGDSKKFKLIEGMMRELILELKKAADEFDTGILLTTSRRTPEKIETLLKDEFKDYPRAKLLVIANENNIPQTVGGILSLSSVIVTSPESISMVSEAASSGKPTIVFNMPRLSKKHKTFLQNLSQDRFICLIKINEVAGNIKTLLTPGNKLNKLDDAILVKEALRKIL